jgi:hypothetical protein
MRGRSAGEDAVAAENRPSAGTVAGAPLVGQRNDLADTTDFAGLRSSAVTRTQQRFMYRMYVSSARQTR